MTLDPVNLAESLARSLRRPQLKGANGVSLLEASSRAKWKCMARRWHYVMLLAQRQDVLGASRKALCTKVHYAKVSSSYLDWYRLIFLQLVEPTNCTQLVLSSFMQTLFHSHAP